MSEEEQKKDEVFQEIETADGEKIKVVTADKYEETLKAKEEALAAKEEELAKEKEKEKNFSVLRDGLKKKYTEMTEEERAALSEERREVLKLREEFETEREADRKIRAEGWKKSAFKSLGVVDSEGNIVDEEAYTKLDTAYARINDPEDSADAVLKKMKAAYSLEFGGQPNIGERTIHSAIPFGGGGAASKKSEELSENAKALAGKLNIDLEPNKDNK